MQSTISTVIIDDEPRSIKLMVKMIEEHCPSLKVVGTCDDLTEAREMIERLQPALLLLDIEFPPGTAFSMLERLVHRGFQIVFITAYNNYAAEAYREHASDYLLKPVTKEAMIEAVKRVEEKLHQFSVADISKLAEILKSRQERSSKIPLPSSDGILFVNESDIVHCEASGRYTIIHLDSNKKLTVTKTLKEIEAMLNPSQFFRVHNAHIINLKKILRFHRAEGGRFELSDGSIINVSPSRKNQLMHILMKQNSY
jgi:two-component system, LytTR family, response regulator